MLKQKHVPVHVLQLAFVYWYMYMKVKHLYLNRGKLKKIAEQLN